MIFLYEFYLFINKNILEPIKIKIHVNNNCFIRFISLYFFSILIHVSINLWRL